jgi:hypothetical protein
MRCKAMWLTVMAGFLLGPTTASACDTYLAYTFKRISGSSLDLGGGLQIQPGENSAPTLLIPSVDLSIAIGGSAVIRPAIGLCATAGGTAAFGELGQDETDVVFGAGFAWNVWNAQAGNLGVNVQAAVTHVAMEGGSAQRIPLTVAGEFRANDAAALFLRAGVQVGRTSVDGSGSSTDSDPVGFAGTTLDGGALDFTVAIQVKKGDSDTDVAINAAFTVPLG